MAGSGSWELVSGFCDYQLYLTQWNVKWAFVLRRSLMRDTVASRVTDNCSLGPSRGRADGSLARDGLISHLTRRITMCVSTNEAITRYATWYIASLSASTNVAFWKQNLDFCWLSWTVCAYSLLLNVPVIAYLM